MTTPQQTARETLAQAYVQEKIAQLAEVIDALGSNREKRLFDEHADYLHKRIKYLEGAAVAYMEREHAPNHWEKVDIGNCQWQARITRKALDDLHEQPYAVLEQVYNQGIRVLDALQNPSLLERSTALVTDVYRDSRPKTVEQFKLLDQIYLVGNEDVLKLGSTDERMNAQLRVPVGIRRAKWELMLAVANATSDMGLVSGAGTANANEGLLKTVANYYVDLSLQERGTQNVHVTGGYRMYINTGYHSLRAAVLSGRLDHEAIEMLEQQFHDGKHPELDREKTLRTFHAVRQERQLGLLLHDGGEGRGELSTLASFSGMNKAQELAFREGKDDVEHAVFQAQLEYARPDELRDNAQWDSVRGRIHHAYEVVEGKGFEGRRGKVVDRMESQRTHLYINGARFIRGVRPRPYSHASKDEKYNMLNYVSIPLHGRPVMVDGELDYARPLGKEALENKVEQYDPMIRTIQEASRAPIEEEYLHIQRQGHKAMSIKHASGFQGKQGSSSRDQGR